MKTALVTGGNKGIGFEIVKGLCRQGIEVFLGCRDIERGQESAAVLEAEGLHAIPIRLDVTDDATIMTAAARIDAVRGKLDILVNNAGIAGGSRAKPSEMELRIVKEIYETNVFGVIAVTQAMLPLLRKSDAGRIVNVSSGLGSLTTMTDPASSSAAYLILGYNTSKSALNAVTVQFALELKDTPIKVNSVCPGYTATDLNNFAGPRTPEQGARIAVEMSLIGADGPTGGYFNDAGRVPW
jgi:NAD(P)-dependent dehydrogenase (short-subunit alcohol dehydrogenase family)